MYKWKLSYEAIGEEALLDSKPCPGNQKLRIPKGIEEKIVHLRTTYHLGPDMIVWHLQRYHSIKISRNGCHLVLVRNKLYRLPENIKVRSRSKFKRYEKRVPGHHVQVDVKFLFFNDKQGKRIKRFKYRSEERRGGKGGRSL